jgi:hypothetical protein
VMFDCTRCLYPLLLGAPSPQALDITVQGGGKAGIWQSGMGIAADGNRVFFATGYVNS